MSHGQCIHSPENQLMDKFDRCELTRYGLLNKGIIAEALTDRLSSKANASTRVARVEFEIEEWALL